MKKVVPILQQFMIFRPDLLRWFLEAFPVIFALISNGVFWLVFGSAAADPLLSLLLIFPLTLDPMS